MGSLGISRPATPNTGMVLAKIRVLIINALQDRRIDWDSLLEHINGLSNMSTIKTLVDDDLLKLSTRETLGTFVEQLFAHARGAQTPAAPGYAQCAQLSQCLSSPYLALLSLVYKMNQALSVKLSLAELQLPIMHYEHIFTPHSESGYHHEDAAYNRRVKVHATNPVTVVYGGTWRKLNRLPKFSNFFPVAMSKDEVCMCIREAFANQIADSLEINGTAKRVILGRTDRGMYIEMPVYYGVSVNAYPIFSFTKLPTTPDHTWSVQLGTATYSYAQLLEIIRDAVFHHFNDAIRYTKFMQDGREFSIIDIALSEKFDASGIKYGVYIQVSRTMLHSLQELREKYLIMGMTHRRTPVEKV